METVQLVRLATQLLVMSVWLLLEWLLMVILVSFALCCLRVVWHVQTTLIVPAVLITVTQLMALVDANCVQVLLQIVWSVVALMHAMFVWMIVLPGTVKVVFAGFVGRWFLTVEDVLIVLIVYSVWIKVTFLL